MKKTNPLISATLVFSNPRQVVSFTEAISHRENMEDLGRNEAISQITEKQFFAFLVSINTNVMSNLSKKSIIPNEED